MLRSTPALCSRSPATIVSVSPPGVSHFSWDPSVPTTTQPRALRICRILLVGTGFTTVVYQLDLSSLVTRTLAARQPDRFHVAAADDSGAITSERRMFYYGPLLPISQGAAPRGAPRGEPYKLDLACTAARLRHPTLITLLLHWYWRIRAKSGK